MTEQEKNMERLFKIKEDILNNHKKIEVLLDKIRNGQKGLDDAVKHYKNVDKLLTVKRDYLYRNLGKRVKS